MPSTDAKIGYVINLDHQGRGFASEAARALVALGFDGIGLHRVTARIDQRKPASSAVFRNAGMWIEAVLVENEWCKGERSTEVDFAILEGAWRRLPP